MKEYANMENYYIEYIEMIKFIQCLSNLNMPLKEIKKNTNMLYEDKIEIQTILKAHLKFLNDQKNLINSHIKLIEEELNKESLI